MARVITSEPFGGYVTCGRPTIADQDYGDAVRPEDCPAYLESRPAMIVREEVQLTFADNGATAAESTGMNVDMVERSSVRYAPADGDWSCPECGFEMCSFTPEPKPVYRHLSEQDPNELRRRSLRQDKVAEAQLSVAERQAAALEQLAAQGQDSQAHPRLGDTAGTPHGASRGVGGLTRYRDTPEA